LGINSEGAQLHVGEHKVSITVFSEQLMRLRVKDQSDSSGTNWASCVCIVGGFVVGLT